MPAGSIGRVCRPASKGQAPLPCSLPCGPSFCHLGPIPSSSRRSRLAWIAARDLRLAASGPCRFVRHPLYSALAILRISIPLVLGSLLGLIAAIAIVASLLLRRVIEDRDLHENVPGYADYSRRIHYRHIPSLW